MKLTPINKNLSVADQLSIKDIASLATDGFRALVCNRPDGEDADQTPFAEIETKAKSLGLVAVYLPVVTGHVTQDDAARFGQLMATLPKPVLAYCRSGARSTTLWTLSHGTSHAFTF